MMQFRRLSLSLALSGLALATLAGCAGGPAERPAGVLFADAAPEVTIEQPSFARPGYSAFVRGDRLWVFEANSPACKEFVANGPSLARAVRINDGGPDGMTICADSGATIDGYLCSRVGFRVEVVDDRVWVFRADSPEHGAFLADGPPRQHAVHIHSGPGGRTLKAPDSETLAAYLEADGALFPIVAAGPEDE